MDPSESSAQRRPGTTRPEDRLLAERTRMMLGAAALSVSLFTVLDLLSPDSVPDVVFPLHAVQFLLLAIGWLAVTKESARSTTIVVLFFSMITQAICMTLLGRIVGDLYTPSLLLTLFALMAAVLLPWGWPLQAAGAVLVAAGSLASLRFISGSMHAALSYPALALGVSLIFSVLVVKVLDTYRRRSAIDREELRRSEARFRELVQDVDAAVWEIELPSLEVLFLSRDFASVLGYPARSRGEGLDAFLSRIHPEDRESFAAAAAALAKGQGYEHEYRLVAADGHSVWIHENARVGFDPDGRASRVRGISVDITALRSDQEALARRSQLVEILDASPDLVSTTDARGRTIYTNPAGRHLLGIGADEDVETLTFDQFLAPEVREFFLKEIVPAAMRDGIWRGELMVRDRAGLEIPLAFVFLAHRDAGGRFRFFSSTAHDISGEKRSAEQIRALNEELGQRVAERTRQLEEAMHEMEAFSYSVSHDLRAPLRRIDGFCALLGEELGDRLDDRQKSYIDRVRQGAQGMGVLIDAQLNLARVSRAQIRREHVDLSRVVGELVGDLRAADPQRRVESVIEPGLVAVADLELVTIALDNLLSNAWKYTRRREDARIEFGLLKSEEAGESGEAPRGVATWFLRDNGAGFDMAYAKKLFGSFQRLHHDREFEGTGIGLATVDRIVRRHGGRVWAEASPGRGATFYFTLEESLALPASPGAPATL